jgi:hypothetical protein
MQARHGDRDLGAREEQFYADVARQRARKDRISSRAALIPSRSKIAPEIT